MRIAIAISLDAAEIFPGPFGHAPFFAVYENRDGGWQRIELRDNPYKALEGGGKGRLLSRLLADCQMWFGAQFGHENATDQERSKHGVPLERLRRVATGARLDEILASLDGAL